MSEKLKLNNKLKEYRLKQGKYTQQQLANEVNCSRQTIIALENNKYNPSLILALTIAEKLEVSVNQIFSLKKGDE